MERSCRFEAVQSVRKPQPHEEEATDWVLQQAGELGISDDILTKYSMIEAYCTEQPEPERVQRTHGATVPLE